MLGKNGAGKSSLLRILSLVEKPAGGEIRYRGKTLKKPSDAEHIRKRFSVVWQKPVVFSGTVRTNLQLACRFKGVDKPAESIIELLSIEHLLDRRADELSGGETRRVMLAMAFAGDPEIVFLDEPTSFLDEKSRQEFLDIIVEVVRETSAAVVYVTHRLDECLRLGRKVTVMHDGRVLRTGTLEEVLEEPGSVEAADLLGNAAVAEGTVVSVNNGSALVRTESGVEIHGTCSDTVKPGDLVHAVVRPESVTLSLEADKTSARNTFRLTVESVNSSGYFYEVRLGGPIRLRSIVTEGSLSELGIKAGQEVYASVKATAVKILKSVNGKGEAQRD